MMPRQGMGVGAPALADRRSSACVTPCGTHNASSPIVAPCVQCNWPCHVVPRSAARQLGLTRSCTPPRGARARRSAYRGPRWPRFTFVQTRGLCKGAFSGRMVAIRPTVLSTAQCDKRGRLQVCLLEGAVSRFDLTVGYCPPRSPAVEGQVTNRHNICFSFPFGSGSS